MHSVLTGIEIAFLQPYLRTLRLRRDGIIHSFWRLALFPGMSCWCVGQTSPIRRHRRLVWKMIPPFAILSFPCVCARTCRHCKVPARPEILHKPPWQSRTNYNVHIEFWRATRHAERHRWHKLSPRQSCSSSTSPPIGAARWRPAVTFMFVRGFVS